MPSEKSCSPPRIRFRGAIYQIADSLETDTEATKKDQAKELKEWGEKKLDPSHPASKAVKPHLQYPREKKVTEKELRRE